MTTEREESFQIEIQITKYDDMCSKFVRIVAAKEKPFIFSAL